MTIDRSTGWLSTRRCALLIGVSTDFVRGEIRDGRLHASRIVRTGKRPVYRVSVEAFDAYRVKHWGQATLTSSQSR